MLQGLGEPEPAAELAPRAEAAFQPSSSWTAHPVTKLYGLPRELRLAFKRRGLTTVAKLLAALGKPEDRARLAGEARVDPEALLAIVRRADMARVNGIGPGFGLLLEDVGILDVAGLAAQDPRRLHARLRRHNAEQRLTRRSPTPEEVADWVAQARSLPPLVAYDGEAAGARARA